jgi:hypothetical protein
MEFKKFKTLNKLMIWEEEDKTHVKFVVYLKWYVSKDEEETEQEYQERADYFIKYKNVFENEEDLIEFCAKEWDNLRDLLIDLDIYELDEENVFKSQFSPKGETGMQPLVKWNYERAIRFFDIPALKDKYGHPDNLLNEFNAAEEFFDEDGSLEVFRAIKSAFEK